MPERCTDDCTVRGTCVPARKTAFWGPGTLLAVFLGPPERRSGAFRLTLTPDGMYG